MTTKAAGGSLARSLRSWVDSPTGPKTTHFWGPAANWGFVAAGISDSLTKPPDAINPRMTAVLSIYSALFMRFAWRVRPGPNWILFSCHASNCSVQLLQLARWYNLQPAV